ncbi:MAG: stress protein, partial [Planctomycetia bacterium]
AKLGVAPMPQAEPYYQPPDGGAAANAGSPAPSSGPVFGAPIPPEQLPPGAVIAPGPPVPVESLPLPPPR